MWHFAELRFVDQIFLGFADLKLTQVFVHFKKEDFWNFLRQCCAAFCRICEFLICELIIKICDLRTAKHKTFVDLR
jgi:hypothetical protein